MSENPEIPETKEPAENFMDGQFRLIPLSAYAHIPGLKAITQVDIRMPDDSVIPENTEVVVVSTTKPDDEPTYNYTHTDGTVYEGMYSTLASAVIRLDDVEIEVPGNAIGQIPPRALMSFGF